ncbi:hypothetical protein Ancab_013240 [Ancistrocladus abbreviatus]
MFRVRVNKEITRECLYFPGKDCRPGWGTKNADSLGFSTSSKGCAEIGEFLDNGRANIQKMSEDQLIRNHINDERAWGNNMAEMCTKAASYNDDTVDKRLCKDVNGGERNRETEGLVERDEPADVQETINAGSEKLMHKGTIERNMQLGRSEPPSITQRELDGATFFLGCGPVCRNNGEVDGLSTSSRHLKIRREKGGNEKTEGCNHPKPRPKKVGVLNRGPVYSRNNGEIVKTFDGLSTSSGFPEIRREESGNEKMEKGNHQKSRPKKMGCIKPTVKLGVGAQQRTSGGLKKNKKKSQKFPRLYYMTTDKLATIEDLGEWVDGKWLWVFNWSRRLCKEMKIGCLHLWNASKVSD